MSFNKHSSRGNIPISRDADYTDRGDKLPSWLEDFASNIEKNSVHSKKEDDNLYNQINSILGNKSKYSTVDEIVLDMQKRTGLFDLLQKKRSNAEKKMPEIFSAAPEMKTFIDNYVEERPGTSVIAVVHDLLKMNSVRDKLPQPDDVPDDVKHYINDKIGEANLLHPAETKGDDLNLGKLDLSVDDNVAADNNPFSGCEPKRASRFSR
jgi:hypothetical protein